MRETERVGMQTAHKTDPVSKLIYELSKLPGHRREDGDTSRLLHSEARRVLFAQSRRSAHQRQTENHSLRPVLHVHRHGSLPDLRESRARSCLDLRGRASLGCVLRRAVRRATKASTMSCTEFSRRWTESAPKSSRLRELLTRARQTRSHASAKSSSRPIRASKAKRPRFTSRA